jgi:hypothetical protein
MRPDEVKKPRIGPLDCGQHGVLIRNSKLGERRVAQRSSLRVDRGESHCIGCAGRFQSTGQRAIDVAIRTSFKRAGPVFIRRDEPADDRPDRLGFRRRQRNKGFAERCLCAYSRSGLAAEEL